MRCTRLILGTHPETDQGKAVKAVKQYVRFGCSPRGGQAIILAAKIRALWAGRYNVSVDDIRAVAPPALRHRLILNFEGEAEQVHPDTIIAELIRTTPVD